MTTGSIVDSTILHRAGSDPLGVLESCAMVVNEAVAVSIDHDAIARIADTMIADATPPPAWDSDIHFHGSGPDALEHTIGWIMALDALNFCFWGQGDDPAFRWRIASGGAVYDGYLALAIALRDAAQSGVPVWDPAWLARVDEAAVASIFAPVPGSSAIPLLAARAAHLRELGKRLPGSSGHPWQDFVAATGWSAPNLAAAVITTFPSFDDTALWSPPSNPDQVRVIRFHKRAQILASDLAAALASFEAPVVSQVDLLTAFADYKVPQVLHHLGLIRYSAMLAARIAARVRLEPGSREEVEIRSATVWACELLRQELVAGGRAFTAAEVDWLLWTAGQALPHSVLPYHRTTTVFY